MKNIVFRYFFVLVFICYFIMLLQLIVFKGAVSLFSTEFHSESENGMMKGFALANFIPFKTIYYYLSLQENAETGARNIGGNILLFIPYGILLPLAFVRINHLRSALAVVFFTSMFFELIQLVTGIGNFDVDDLLLNTLGGMTGVFLVSFFFDLHMPNHMRQKKVKAGQGKTVS